MGQYPHTAPKLSQLAALFRQSAEASSHPEIQEKLRGAATEIEARARAVASHEQPRSQPARNLFAPIDFVV